MTVWSLCVRPALRRAVALGLSLLVAAPATLVPGGAAAAPNVTSRQQKLHPALRDKIQAAAPSERLTVVIKGRHKAPVDAVKYRSEDVIAALKAAAKQSQDPIIAYLNARGAKVVRTFWLTNAVVAEIDRPTLDGMLSLDAVDVVFENFAMALPPVERSAATPTEGDLTWGLQKIQASRVWNELGVTGQGVRVAVLDTGVDISHPDLTGKMQSDNPGDPNYPGGWIEFDGGGNPVASPPHDSAGHGTHVSGTILGGNASGTHIGVAPGATLMAALVLPGGGGTFAQVVAGMQWAVEPTDASGNPAGKRADIASMSWGAFGARPEVVEPVRNMIRAGVLPIAAAGNCGKECIGSPGAVYEAFAVGASDINDDIASFSSGAIVHKSDWQNAPDEWPDEWVKPNLSAPGVNVLSSVPGGGYEAWNGTSMATPHVSGTAALMLSANPNLTPDLILQALSENAFWDNRYGESRPNIRFGQGRIDAFEATAIVALKSGITGGITDDHTGAPLGEAIVRVVGGTQVAHTKADGTFTLALKPGTYAIQIERFGYEPGALADITVIADQKKSVHVALVPLPTGVIRGKVAFARNGHGIPGVAMRVAGVPIRIETETDANGEYQIILPVGSYNVGASAYGFAAASLTAMSVTAGQTTTGDLQLTSMPRVGIVGDIDEILTRFLKAEGFVAEAVDFDIANNIDTYSAVVVNLPSWETGTDRFKRLVEAAGDAGVGMLFTKGYWYGWGIDLLHDAYGDPAVSNFDYAKSNLVGEVIGTQESILPGRSVGDTFDLLPCCGDVGWFEQYSGTPVLALSVAKSSIGKGVAYRQNANNRHVLLGSLGALWWQGPDQWTQEGRQLFVNALRWAAKPETAGPHFVLWDLKATPDTVLWYQPVQVSVGIKNIGEESGARQVALTINGAYESAQQSVLVADAYQYLSFTVQRDPIGSYRAQIGHLSRSFRVRPPKVTVTAQTLSLPPSGRGNKADPGEPAIPLVGARVSLVQKGRVIDRGRLDGNGTLTFDSTASHGQYTIVIRHTNFGYNTPRHYLLTLPATVEDDTGFTFAPQQADTTLLDARLTAKSPDHHGSLFLANSATDKVAFEFPTGPIVLTPGEYRVANVMAYDQPGGQWAYASTWEPMTLTATSTSYSFGGDLTLHMADVLGQQAPRVSLSWGLSDAYAHEINSVYTVAAKAFGPMNNRIVVDSTTWPETVAATAKIVQKPVLTLTNPLGAIEQTGEIGWAERPREIALATDTVKPGAYGLLLETDTGPYQGKIATTATLILPARSLSRSLVLPGDTFDVTLRFDAGQAGNLILTESLPPGFSIIRQSSVPTAEYSAGAWTWHPSGKGAYRPGQTIKVTYTVRVAADAPTGTYAFTGTVAQSGTARIVAGPQAIIVARTLSQANMRAPF